MIKIDLRNVTDAHKFKDLALLFDNPEFQVDLEKLKISIKEDWEKYPDLASHMLNSTADGEAQSLIQKYKYPRGFTRAVMAAATSNKVTDSDVANCYSAVLMHPLSLLDEYKPVLTKDDFVIFINPQAIRGNKQAMLIQVGKLLDEAAKNVKPISKKHPLKRDVRSNIRQVRDWYWERKLNKTKTLELVEKDSHQQNTIDKAISDYSKLLLNSEF